MPDTLVCPESKGISVLPSLQTLRTLKPPTQPAVKRSYVHSRVQATSNPVELCTEVVRSITTLDHESQDRNQDINSALEVALALQPTHASSAPAVRLAESNKRVAEVHRPAHADAVGDPPLFGFLDPCNPSRQRLNLFRIKPRVTIGRGSQNDIVLGCGTISKPTAQSPILYNVTEILGQIHAEIIWNRKTDSSSCVILKDRNSTNGTWVNGIRVKVGAHRILKQGNEISFGSEQPLADPLLDNDCRYIFHHLASGSSSDPDFFAHYDLGAELGRGSFGIAYKAISKANGQCYAVKMIRKRGDMSTVQNTYLQREIGIMRSLKHPNICELQDVFIQFSEIGASLCSFT
ncbi:hypothetical protein V5O48_010894 [Marasmius crinis-equi]|uniref:Uncharacterized protein n=1 Tax=Marasmius crinis-equi TaxID=585013 RepID=A0ABR3F729_9AGAR